MPRVRNVRSLLPEPTEKSNTSSEPVWHVFVVRCAERDRFQTYLRELRASDLDGSAGLYRMKEELTRRVNVAIAPGKINAVLFKELIVQ